MALRQRLPAGLFDSAFASLATFLVGVYAVRTFEPDELGVYAIFFSAFGLAQTVPAGLVFTAVRVELLDVSPRRRVRAAARSLVIGIVPALVASLLVLTVIPFAGGESRTDLAVPLAVTSALASFVSPMQDQVRAVFHLGECSWAAAATSALQLLAVSVLLPLASVVSVDGGWIPFGVLAVANTVSVSAGLAYSLRFGEKGDPVTFEVGKLFESGRWYFIIDLLKAGVYLLVSVTVVAISSASVLGLAEAARVAARPVTVVVTGVSMVVLPRAMSIGRSRDRSNGVRLQRYTGAGIAGLATIYAILAGGSWHWNIMSRIAPVGYSVPGLVPLTVGATAGEMMLFVERGQLMGARQERMMTVVEAAASVCSLAAALLAVLIGAYAVPLSVIVMMLARWFGYQVLLRRHYG